jgi:hypothetical protein
VSSTRRTVSWVALLFWVLVLLNGLTSTSMLLWGFASLLDGNYGNLARSVLFVIGMVSGIMLGIKGRFAFAYPAIGLSSILTLYMLDGIQ